MSKDLKVVVTSNDCPQVALDILHEHFTVVQSQYSGFNSDSAEDNVREVLEQVPGASALFYLTSHSITPQLLDKAGCQLEMVATPSSGYDHCNVSVLKSRGIKLSNTPNVVSAAVSEIAVALMLGVARRFTENLEQVRQGKWETGFQTMLGVDLRGSTIGIVGLGGIGVATLRRLASFEVGQFLYTAHMEKPEGTKLGAKFVSLDQLLRESDFIVLSCPLTDETRHIINKDSLAKMKSNAILVNIGRGDLIEQEALYTALKNKQIYGAGLDVTTPEPLPKDHPLLTLPNVFILPHIGTSTERTHSNMAVLAARNVVNALQGKSLITPVLP